MKKKSNILGIIAVTALSTQFSCADNKVQILETIDSNLKALVTAGGNDENSIIQSINTDPNIDTKDAPTSDKSYKKPSKDVGEIICYKSDTGKIVAADSPNKINTPFDSKLVTQISEALGKDDDGKVEIEYNQSTRDPNNAKKELTEPMIIVAWGAAGNGKNPLVGDAKSTLVCTIAAPLPAV